MQKNNAREATFGQIWPQRGKIEILENGYHQRHKTTMST